MFMMTSFFLRSEKCVEGFILLFKRGRGFGTCRSGAVLRQIALAEAQPHTSAAATRREMARTRHV